MSQITLEAGGNAVLPDQTRVRIRLVPEGGSLPRVAVVLANADRKAAGGRPVVRIGTDDMAGTPFHLPAAAPEGQAIAFDVALDRVPADVAQIHVCLLRGDAPWPGVVRSVADAPQAPADGVRFDLATGQLAERVLVFTSLYRHKGLWKLRAFGQGYAGGEEKLAAAFGFAPRALFWPSSAPAPEVAARPAGPPPAVPSATGRISLAKRGDGVSLEKKSPAGFGEIRFALSWKAGNAGGLRGIFGGGAVDLDLGCLWELADGRKGVVQALGGAFGSLTGPPFLQLAGDDREGGGGEEIRINGRRVDQIRRLVAFAYIYRGVPNWQAARALATVAVPGHPVIEVQLDTPERTLGMCALARIDVTPAGLRVTREERYVRGHQDLDEAFGWGLNWVPGRKNG